MRDDETNIGAIAAVLIALAALAAAPATIVASSAMRNSGLGLAEQGNVGLLGLASVALLAPIGGRLADTFDRRILLAIGSAIIALSHLAVAVATVLDASAAEWSLSAIAYVSAFAGGAGSALAMPALIALLFDGSRGTSALQLSAAFVVTSSLGGGIGAALGVALRNSSLLSQGVVAALSLIPALVGVVFFVYGIRTPDEVLRGRDATSRTMGATLFAACALVALSLAARAPFAPGASPAGAEPMLIGVVSAVANVVAIIVAIAVCFVPLQTDRSFIGALGCVIGLGAIAGAASSISASVVAYSFSVIGGALALAAVKVLAYAFAERHARWNERGTIAGALVAATYGSGLLVGVFAFGAFANDFARVMETVAFVAAMIVALGYVSVAFLPASSKK